MMIDCFQMVGMLQVRSERLNSLVMKVMPRGPRCLRCQAVMLLGSGAVEFLELAMAVATCCGVKVGALVSGSDLILRLVMRSFLELVLFVVSV